MPYRQAWELQHTLVEAKTSGEMTADAVLLLEHPPVFTLGRRGGGQHLKVDEDFLSSRGIPLVQVERGGEITYHGPGQLVGYPIVNLRAAKCGVVDFVEALEEVMIRTVGEWGIRAERNRLNRGAWVGLKKIGSVGIAVRRGISFHGFALNVDVSLEPFAWMDPCGLRGVQATSMARVLEAEVPLSAARRTVREKIEEVFNVKLTLSSLPDLGPLLKQAVAPSGGRGEGYRTPEG